MSNTVRKHLPVKISDMSAQQQYSSHNLASMMVLPHRLQWVFKYVSKPLIAPKFQIPKQVPQRKNKACLNTALGLCKHFTAQLALETYWVTQHSITLYLRIRLQHWSECVVYASLVNSCVHGNGNLISMWLLLVMLTRVGTDYKIASRSGTLSVVVLTSSRRVKCSLTKSWVVVLVFIIQS